MMVRLPARFLFGTLRGRLIVGVAAVHAVMMTLFIIDLTVRQRALLLDRQVDEATALCQALATTAAGWIVANDVSGLQEIVEAQRRYPELLFAVFADTTGRVLADTDRSKRGLYLLDLPAAARHTVSSRTPALVDVATPVMVGGSPVGWARVGIGQELAARKLISITRDGLLYALAAILLGSLIAWRMGRRVTRRLYAVQETMNAVRAGDAYARCRLPGTDEAAMMANEFDAMLDAVTARDTALRDSEQKYRTLIESANDAVFIHEILADGTPGPFIEVNDLAMERLGYTRAELTSMSPQDLDDPGLRERIPMAMDRLMADGHAVFETAQMTKDGRSLPVEVSTRVLELGGRRLLFSLVRDITERKQAADALMTREREYRALVEHLPAMVVRYDTNLRRTYVNPAWERASGLSASEVVGVPAGDIGRVPKASVPEYLAALRRAMETGESQNAEFTWTNADGRALDLQYVVVPEHDEHGLVVGALAMGHDIGDRKRAEQEHLEHLRFLECMDRINRAIQGTSDLTQMMSDVLDEVLSIFDCDRAWLVCPCDPLAPMFRVAMERGRSEYGATSAVGVDVPVVPAVAQLLQTLCDAEGPVRFGPGADQPLPRYLTENFSVQSQIVMAVYPIGDKPYAFGLHQCSHTRVWTVEEGRLVNEIGHRVGDALASLVAYRDVQAGEQRYRMVFENSPVALWEEDLSAVKGRFDDLTQEGVADIESYFEQHPDFVRECTEAARVVDVNQAALTLHGAANKAELLAGLARTFSPESYETFGRELVCLWQGGREMATDTVVKTLAGECRTVSVHFAVCPGYEQTLSRVLVSVTDITERQRAEQEARHLAAIVESSDDAIVAKDMDGVIVSWNRGAERVYGYTAAEALGQPVTMLVPPGREEEVWRIIDTIRSGAHVESYEAVRRCKDGRDILVSLTASPVRDPSGQIVAVSVVARDITAHRRAEEARRESEARLLEAQRVGRLGSWDWDSRTDTITWSEEYYLIYGLDPSRRPPGYEEHLRVYTAESAARLDAAVKHSLQTGAPYVLDLEQQRTDGTTRWLTARGEVKRDADGQIVGLRGTAQDITERKRSEETLRRLNRELAAISNCNQALLRAIDEESLLREICHIVCAEAGYRLAWVGFAQSDQVRTVAPVAWAGAEDGYLSDANITWADTDRGRGPAGACIRTGEVVCIGDIAQDPRMAPWRAAALQRGYRSALALPLKDEQGSVFGAFVVYGGEPHAIGPEERRLMGELAADLAFGISVVRGRVERRRAEESLALRNRINEIFLTYPDDRMYAEALQVVLEATGSRCGLFGYLDEDGALIAPSLTTDVWDRCQVADKSLAFPPETWGAGLWARAMKEKTSIYRNEGLSVPAGHLALERALAVPVLYQQCVIGLMVVANKDSDYDDADQRLLESIAHVHAAVLNARLQRERQERHREQVERERETLHEQLLQAQKMESVGRLAGGVAHDFNNMLEVVIGYSELAIQQLDPDHQLQTFLGEICKAAHRSAKLTRQLLAFARKQVAAPEVLELNATVEGMLKMLRRLIGEDIDLVWLPGAALSRVKMDPSQIDQILANLCVNARDAIAGVGKISIETRSASLDEAYCASHHGAVPGDYALLAVTDNGCGMDPPTLAMIFEPFFTTKELGRGTGLGLATVYGIVQQNRGVIDVSSEPGSGTRFEIYLPCHRSEIGSAAVDDSEPPVPRGTETILIVEDDPSILNLTALILNRQGYCALPAETPGEALRLVEQPGTQVQLLVTDVIMPEMSGRDLSRRLQARSPDLKVLYMSGYTASVIAEHGVLNEGVDFIQKPFTLRDLAVKVRAILDRDQRCDVTAPPPPSAPPRPGCPPRPARAPATGRSPDSAPATAAR